jgi:hypothetical protein
LPTQRQLFFKTTPKPEAGQVRVKYGHTDYLPWLLQKQDVFLPEMIERYLAGYDPAQSEEFRFCDDPLRAHFHQDHVAALAHAYGFLMKVAVRRVDKAGAEYASPLLLQPLWAFATDPGYLSPVDQLRYKYAVESACAGPTPGATASVLTPLEPEAWYEVYVLAQSENGDFEDGRLPGVTFRTSRWRKPEEMFAGLGFPTAGEPAPASLIVGDLVINSPAAVGAAVVEGDDQAYQRALQSLGLEGWPIAASARLSRLWVADADGSWLLAGIMIESPEPIHRPGRLDLTGLVFQTGAGAPVSFDIRRRDRSGSRLICLTSGPIRVSALAGGPPQIVLKARSTLNNAGTDLNGVLLIPPAPAFSEDPL